MVFTEPVFLFLLLPLLSRWLVFLPLAAHNTTLLAASVAFYAWGEGTLFWLLLHLVTATYVCALGVIWARARHWRRLWLMATSNGGDQGAGRAPPVGAAQPTPGVDMYTGGCVARPARPTLSHSQ
jgi:hypothetical protein